MTLSEIAESIESNYNAFNNGLMTLREFLNKMTELAIIMHEQKTG